MRNETYKLIDDITRIGNRAIYNAQKENWDNGLPNVYEINDKIVFALPDGTFLLEYKFS